MSNKKKLKEEIFKRLGCHGFEIEEHNDYTNRAYRSYVLVLQLKEEIDNDGRKFMTNYSDIPDDMYEDAIGWLNTLLPYR